jgi:hypothetical protein
VVRSIAPILDAWHKLLKNNVSEKWSNLSEVPRVDGTTGDAGKSLRDNSWSWPCTISHQPSRLRLACNANVFARQPRPLAMVLHAIDNAGKSDCTRLLAGSLGSTCVLL